MEYNEENHLSQEQFALLLQAMPNNAGLFIEKDGDKMVLNLLKPEDLKKLGENPNLFHVVGMWIRPWVGYFMNWLEYEHFPPETPLNAEFQFRVFKWHDIIWSIASIPIEKKQLCYEGAEASHLRLADGIPIMAGGDTVRFAAAIREADFQKGGIGETFDQFPLATDNTFTLEQKRGDILYEPGGAQDAKIEEDMKIHKLWEKHGQDKPLDEFDPWSNT